MPITSAFIAVLILILLTFAMLTFATPDAQATPTIAKGKPCATCHSSSKPSKSDLKK
jgi:hypothetical protein